MWSQLELDNYDLVRPLEAFGDHFFYFQFLWPPERFLHPNIEELMMGNILSTTFPSVLNFCSFHRDSKSERCCSVLCWFFHYSELCRLYYSCLMPQQLSLDTLPWKVQTRWHMLQSKSLSYSGQYSLRPGRSMAWLYDCCHVCCTVMNYCTHVWQLNGLRWYINSTIALQSTMS